MTTARGTLIVFEGLDRAGKSTQCELLAKHLRSNGRVVESMRFPDRATPIGQAINSYLAGESQQEDHVMHLLFSANRWERAQAIKDHINGGKTVIIDRYYYSGCVYSAAKQKPDLSLEWCRQPEVGLPRPDICIFLDISAEAAAKRGGFGAERYEKQEMQDRVRHLFTELRAHEDEAGDIVVIDAGRSVEDVERSIQKAVGAACERASTHRSNLRFVAPWR